MKRYSDKLKEAATLALQGIVHDQRVNKMFIATKELSKHIPASYTRSNTIACAQANAHIDRVSKQTGGTEIHRALSGSERRAAEHVNAP